MAEGSKSSKSSGAPTPDETFLRNEHVRPPYDPSEYFNRVFSPGDLYRSLNKQRTMEQEAEGSAQTKNPDAGLPGSKSQGKPGSHNQDEKLVYVNEPIESSCFGSSVHYGGRDFYVTSYSPQTSENMKSYGIDQVDDANVATRGEWWQGSYHY